MTFSVIEKRAKMHQYVSHWVSSVGSGESMALNDMLLRRARGRGWREINMVHDPHDKIFFRCTHYAGYANPMRSETSFIPPRPNITEVITPTKSTKK